MSDQVTVIYPRAYVQMSASVRGTDISTGLYPSRAKVQLRPHHQCSTCEVTTDLSALPFDLRVINSVFVSVYMGVVKTIDGDIKDPKYLVFCGYVDDAKNHRSEKGSEVELRARDLSALLRDDKPLVSRKDSTGNLVNPLPKYSDTLSDAIKRIFKWSGLSDDVLEVSDTSSLGSFKLSSCVESGRAANGYVPIKREASAWDAIEHVAAMANLLVSIDLGKLVIRKPTDQFGSGSSGNSKMKFIFGDADANVLEVSTEKKFLRNRKGVLVQAYNPKTRRVVTGKYPADADIPPKKRAKMGVTKKSKGKTSTAAPKEPDRDIYAIGLDGIHTSDQAQKVAERIYRERSAQELEGDLETVVWKDDLFTLRNGDRITISINPALEAELNKLNDQRKQIDYLKAHGVVTNDDAAKTLLNAQKNSAGDGFYLRSVTHDWSPSKASSKLDFINLINLT